VGDGDPEFFARDIKARARKSGSAGETWRGLVGVEGDESRLNRRTSRR
jgi:hypothetical protein